jgi:hypothetical protein
MKKKLVGIFVMTLLITTAMSAVGTINEKETPSVLRLGNKSLNSISTPQSGNSINRGGMFIQLPPNPEAFFSISYTSSSDTGYACFEDFWEISSPICDVHWWGNSQIHENGTWHYRDPEGMTFNISFWDAAGFFVCSYEDVKPSITYTGIQHQSTQPGFSKKLNYFETELDPCVNLSAGWIGIQSTYCPSGGWFLWMISDDGNDMFYHEYHGQGQYIFDQDLAVVLTDGEPADPALGCEGKLSWSSVKPGETVNGSFLIANTGDNGSVLQWRIDNTTLPTWGSNWTVTPSADFQTTDMGWLWVNVSVTAPPEENQKLTGKIKVVNAVDPSDICEVDVSLNTPRNKETYNTLLLRLFERFPNIFPILRYILQVQ